MSSDTNIIFNPFNVSYATLRLFSAKLLQSIVRFQIDIGINSLYKAVFYQGILFIKP